MLYKTPENFGNAFLPTRQNAILTKFTEREIHTSDKFPSITNACNAFGKENVVSLLMMYCTDLCNYAGNNVKMDSSQIETLALMFVREYGYLKIAEVVEFFSNVKIGKYGHFYGAVDPITIGEMFGQYYEDRKNALTRINNEDVRMKIGQDSQNGTSAMIHTLQINYKLAKYGLPGPYTSEHRRKLVKILKSKPYAAKRSQVHR